MLLPDDEAFLKRKGYTYEVFEEKGETLVVLKDYKLAERYMPDKTDVLIRILKGYPETMLDSFWTKDVVSLKSTGQRAPNATEMQPYLGQQWQFWSRHLQAWRGGIDNLETFVTAVLRELDQ